MRVVTATGVGGGCELKGQVHRLCLVGDDGSVVELDDGSHHHQNISWGKTKVGRGGDR
jgi:hypothetical protein